MAKSKSKVNKDFQKVKFKVGKRIQKNANDTKATFKAKTLILKQQFKDDKSTTNFQKNLSTKELFAHLGHYNQNFKLEALNSLRDEIASNEETLKYEFNSLLENVCPLFTDKDYKVRESGMDFFKTLILNSYISRNDSLRPFYHLISVHLSCAMTHIVENIQYSSLKLLDILIEHKPDFIRVYAAKILENFIDQISKANLKGNKRILKNDPYKLTSTHNWRKNVLSRLNKMLSIVANRDQIAHSTSGSKDNSVITLNFDQHRNCVLTYDNEQNSIFETPIISLNKRANDFDNINDTNGILNKHIRVIVPLLCDCWIEARPEKSNVIDEVESLNLMHLIVSIYDTILENFNISFHEFSKFLSAPKNSDPEKYLEGLLLTYFPYILGDNFDYSEAQKTNPQQINAKTINLLICKIFSSSLINLNEEKLFAIFEYCLKILKPNTANQHESIGKAELQIILKIYQAIFKNFSRIELVEPFLTALIHFHENCHNSTHKWMCLELLCNNFSQNEHFLKCDTYNGMFFKKVLNILIANLKESNEKVCDFLLDWVRTSIMRKENQHHHNQHHKTLAQILCDQFVNILNAIELESCGLSETCKRKVLQLIYWLPKINQYVLTKLAIFILCKESSIFNSIQVLECLKARLDENGAENVIDHKDYLVFLMSLFNGYLSFNLLNKASVNANRKETFILDKPKFTNHVKLCQYLEQFLGSHKNRDEIVDMLISISLPVICRLDEIYMSTLYGSLSLITLLNFENIKNPSNYDNTIVWIELAFNWLYNKQIELISAEDNFNACFNPTTNVDERDCIKIIFAKLFAMFDANQKLLNDIINRLAFKVQLVNNIEEIRRNVVCLNFLIKKYSACLKPTLDNLRNLINIFNFSGTSEFSWMQELSILVSTI